jgi:hypothetical protein
MTNPNDTPPPVPDTPPNSDIPQSPDTSPSSPATLPPMPLPSGEPTLQPPKRGFPKWLLIVLGVSIPLLLVFCVVAGIGVLTLLGNRVEDPEAPKTVITSTDGHSQVSVPQSWETRTDLNDKAEIQVANARIEQYLIVLTEAKADFTFEQLDEYAEVVSDQMLSIGDNATISEPTNLTINGMPALRYRIAATVDNLNVIYWLTAVEGTEYYYQILGWTLASREADNEDTILGVSDSFEETGR